MKIKHNVLHFIDQYTITSEMQFITKLTECEIKKISQYTQNPGMKHASVSRRSKFRNGSMCDAMEKTKYNE